MTGTGGPGRTLLAFAQLEVPWPLGPPDGRYVLRDDADGPVTHVAVMATLGVPEHRRMIRRRPEGADGPRTGRATLVSVGGPLRDEATARMWLQDAGEHELEQGLNALNRVLRAYRLAAADPRAVTVGRDALLAARIGFGAGEQVADGRWTAARELEIGPPKAGRRVRRAAGLAPQSRLAALLGGRDRALACEELVLRARLDLDEHRPREAALQVLVALDAALAELGTDPLAGALAERLQDLRSRRDAIADAAQAALSAPPDASGQAAVAAAVGAIQATLRAREAARQA